MLGLLCSITPHLFASDSLLAFVSNIRMITNYWLRPSNTADSTNYLSFLEDTLDKLANKKVGLIRRMLWIPSLKLLGYSFMPASFHITLVVKWKLKTKLRELTSWSKGYGYDKLRSQLKEYIQGWIGCYRLTDSLVNR